MVFSSDGRLLAVTMAVTDDSSEVKLWDVSTGQSIANLTWSIPFDSGIFSSDGQRLAFWEYDDPRIGLWDVSRGRQHVVSAHEIGVHGSVSIMSFSPDGQLLASGGASDTLVKLWDVSRGGQQVATFPLHDSQGLVVGLAFSPDGRLLASYGQFGPVILWDVSRRQQVATFLMPHGRNGFSVLSSSLLFSPNGRLLASEGQRWTHVDLDNEVEVSHSEVKLLDVSTGQSIATLAATGPMSFSPNGRLLASVSQITNQLTGNEYWASGGQDIELWDVSTGQSIATLPLPSSDSYDRPRRLVFSPDGRLLISQGPRRIDTWDISELVDEQADGEEDGELDEMAELDDLEPDGEDQQESEETPTTAVELKGIAASHDSIREDGPATTITVTVTLDRAAATDEMITLALVSPLVGKPAQRGEDFDATFPEIFTIAKGQRTGTAQLTLTPKDNATADGDKAFAVQATSSSGHAALVNIKIIGNDSADEPQARLMPNPSEVAFSADDPAWKTFTVHTSLDSVLVRANPSGSDPALEVSGGQQVPTRDFCPAEGNDRPSSGRRDGWNLHVKACQAGQTKILLIDYGTGEVVQEYEVNVEVSTSAVASTVLNPSYPNPFNSETVLSYTLPTASAIRLEVFTLSGQRVAVLHEGFQAAGYHTVAMDASDLASGVYLYRLSTPEGRFTQKFTLLR